MSPRSRRLVPLALILLVGLATLTAPSSSAGEFDLLSDAVANWPQFHYGPDHVGFQANESIIGTGNVDQLTVGWSTMTGGSILSSPAVVNGVAYVGSDDAKVYAMDALAGTVLWSRTTGDVVRASPAVVGGVVYVTSLDGILYALDAATGSVLWKFDVGIQIKSSPVVAGGIVYFSSVGNGGPLFGTLWAVSTVTHALIWSAQTFSNTYFTPTISGGVVYLGWENGDFIAYDAKTGDVLWTATLSGGGTAQGSASVSGGLVYVGGTDGYLYAYDASTGVPVWRADGSPAGTTALIKSTPAVFGDTVFVSTGGLTPTMDSWMFAFDASTGALVWSHPLADYSTSSPAVANGVVYVGSYSHQLFAFDIDTGEKLWDSGTTAMGGGIPSSPAVVGGWVYVGSLDGGLYAFTDLPGRPITTYISAQDDLFDPVLADHHDIGTAVQWTNDGTHLHTVTDVSDLGLFDSGTIEPGGTFAFVIMGAGTYSYVCSLHPGMTGSVKAPPVVEPTTGSLLTVFTVQWAGAHAPVGFAYDVQIKRPGDLDWTNWLSAQVVPLTTFLADGGTGTYQFRGRLVNLTTGATSGYSGPASIVVS